MQPQVPIHTFYAILLCSVAALGLTHYLEVEAENAMPIFIAAMLLGVVFGEVAERLSKRAG